ncbi:MAG: hypothetical protein HYX68_16120, partial [Planctomycetes bacterium]|nr:hypothetical protein [Planctomycetota bacterium]
RPQDRQFRVTVAIATEETATTPSTVVWPFVKWPKLGDRQLTVRELLQISVLPAFLLSLELLV